MTKYDENENHRRWYESMTNFSNLGDVFFDLLRRKWIIEACRTIRFIYLHQFTEPPIRRHSVTQYSRAINHVTCFSFIDEIQGDCLETATRTVQIIIHQSPGTGPSVNHTRSLKTPIKLSFWYRAAYVRTKVINFISLLRTRNIKMQSCLKCFKSQKVKEIKL